VNSKRRICFIIPSLQAGGMERVMSELINYTSKNTEFEVNLVLYGSTREIFYPIPKNIKIHTPKFSFSNSFRFFNTIKTLHFLRLKIRSINPVVALSFGEYWNNFVLLSLFGLRVPLFVSDRCKPTKNLGFPNEFLRKILYPFSIGIVAQTIFAKDYYTKLFSHPNVLVIPNPVNQILSLPFSDSGRENIVLMVGRFIETKHQDRLIKMFIELDVKDWKLVLVGYDHLQQQNLSRFKQIVDSHDANEKVIFVGKQSNVIDFYLKSKIFAFTSSSEGFPNVLGEALASGLPVVSYNCEAGPSDIIQDGYNGFLVNVFDDDSFKEKLKLLIENTLLRTQMANNAILSVQQFDSDFISKRYIDFMEASII
jgi:GalNAc-alpha-(1->4)-GalNAc-alpha-(1->3)-diNAcBac-PP-undecaprenol alpha-1,4-N-acetyl-D-galactosaminyltransferase